MNLVTCPRCGAQVEEGILFCPSCQAPLTGKTVQAPILIEPDTTGLNTSKKSISPRYSIAISGILIIVLLTVCSGIWYGSQTAENIFRNYVNAIEQGNYAKANSLVLPSEKSSILVKPRVLMKNTSITMTGKNTATISYIVNGKKYEGTLQAVRSGLAS